MGRACHTGFGSHARIRLTRQHSAHTPALGSHASIRLARHAGSKWLRRAARDAGDVGRCVRLDLPRALSRRSRAESAAGDSRGRTDRRNAPAGASSAGTFRRRPRGTTRARSDSLRARAGRPTLRRERAAPRAIGLGDVSGNVIAVPGRGTDRLHDRHPSHPRSGRAHAIGACMRNEHTFDPRYGTRTRSAASSVSPDASRRPR